MCQSSWKLLLQPSLVPCLLPLIKQGKNFVYKVSQYLEFKAFLLKRILQKQEEMWKISFQNVLTFQEKNISTHYHPSNSLFFFPPFFPFFLRQGRMKGRGSFPFFLLNDKTHTTVFLNKFKKKMKELQRKAFGDFSFAIYL